MTVGTLLADSSRSALAAMPRHRAYGSVARVVGNEVEIRGLAVRVGDVVGLSCPSGERLGEIVALSAEGARALLLGDIAGIGRGDRVRLRPQGLSVVVSDELLGRVLDGTGAPLDGRPAPSGTPLRVEATVPPAMERRRINEALPVGVRMIDSTAGCTIGPPADNEYAVDPVGVATINPSARYRHTKSSSIDNSISIIRASAPFVTTASFSTS